MRQWRVGTISMGSALILLGVVMIFSQFTQWDPVPISFVWLPAILIVLGIEIIVYLILSRREQPVVKYDMLSIVFISLLGTVAIGLYLVASSGILDSIQRGINAEEAHGALPVIEEQIDEQVDHIVIETNETDVTLEANRTNGVDIFGTFRSNVMKKDQIAKEDVAAIHQSGDTLYIQMLSAPSKQVFGYDSSRFDITLSVPGDFDVEVRSPIREVNLNTAAIQGEWFIESTNAAILHETASADLVLSATTRMKEELANIEWDKETSLDEEQGSQQTPPSSKGTNGNVAKEAATHEGNYTLEKTLGQGTHKLSLNQANRIVIRE